MTRHKYAWGTMLIILVLVVSACQFPSLVTEPAGTEPAPPPDTSDAQPTEQPVTDGGDSPPGPPPQDRPSELICDSIQPGSLVFVVCNVRDALRSRNLAALPGFMAEPFVIGYWESEYMDRDIGQVLDELDQSRLPADASQIEFILERSEFPVLYGTPPETILPFDDEIALIVYSTGWGSDGAGEALLYFVRNQTGEFKWQGLLIALVQFDR